MVRLQLHFAILNGVMHALFVILVLAFAGLLWATLATVQHVRRARDWKQAPVQHRHTAQHTIVVDVPQTAHAPSISPGRLIHSKQLQISL